MRAKFEGNLITCLHFIAVFLQMCKKNKKTKKMSDFLKAYISGTTGAIYFMCSPDIPASAQQIWSCIYRRDHRSTNMRKIVLCSSC